MGTILDSLLPFLYLGSLFWSLRINYYSLGFFLVVPYIAAATIMAYIRNFKFFTSTKKRDYWL